MRTGKHQSTTLKHFVTAKILIASLLITYGIYGVMFLLTIPEVVSHAQGMRILDLVPWYSTTYVRELLAALGGDGRGIYFAHQLSLDFIYPGCFMLSSAMFIDYFSRLLHIHHYAKWMCILPIIAGVADYGENVFFTYFALTGEANDLMVSGARIFSLIKTTGVTISIALFMVLIGWYLSRKVRV